MTDSAIICFDAFYNWALRKTYGIPMAIKQTYYDLAEEKVEELSYVPDYDFFNDEIIEARRWVRPIILIPQDGLRYSIIAIIAHCCGNMLNEYVDQMVRNFGSHREGPCRLNLKNEFYIIWTTYQKWCDGILLNCWEAVKLRCLYGDESQKQVLR